MIKLLIIIFLIDLIYLKTVAAHFNTLIMKIQKSDMIIKKIPAVFCYIFLSLGLNQFIIKENRDSKQAFILGLVIYGVYETTNMALFKDWDIKTVLLDTIWGGILFYLSSYVYYNFFKKSKTIN